MNRLSGIFRFCVYRPWLVIGLGTLVCLAAAPGMLRLVLRTDGNALVPAHAEQIIQDQAVRERFNLQDPIVVVVWSRHPDGIFNAQSLELVSVLTKEFQEIESIDPVQVLSLATEIGDRVFPGTLVFRRLLDPLPTTEVELRRLRDDLRVYGLYSGMLVSNDEQGAAILVGVPGGIERVKIYSQINDRLASIDLADHDVSVIGAPVAEALLGTHILQDLGVPNQLLGLYGMREQQGSAAAGGLYSIKTWIARHIGLVPVALVLMALVFYFYFGSLTSVVLPMTEVLACLVFVFGLMGWLGVPIYLTIAVMPIILTAAGVTDEIHVFARYRDRLREHPEREHREVLLTTLDEISRPVLMAGVTTVTGFLAFGLSPIAPVKAFGVFTAIGLAFCMVWSLTVIPACLALAGRERIAHRKDQFASVHSSLQKTFARIAASSATRPLVVLGVLVAVMVAAPLGISRVIVQDSWIDGFALQSEFHQATTRFNAQFHGSHLLLVEVDSGSEKIEGQIPARRLDGLWATLDTNGLPPPDQLIGWRLRLSRTDPLPSDPEAARKQAIANTWNTWITEALPDGDVVRVKGIPSHGVPRFALRLSETEAARYELTPSRLLQPQYMHHVADLESFLESHREQAVGGVMGTAQYVTTVHFLRRGRKAEHRQIPATAEEVDWLWREYSQMRGRERVRQLIDADYSHSIVTVFLRDANFKDTAVLMQDLRDYERQHLAPQGVNLTLAGDVAVSQTLISAIVGTQVVSVAAALAGDLIVTVILGRSLVFGLLCIVPSLLAVLINFAVMGWMSIPLGVATSMFSSMTLGLGVDYAIHFLQNYRQHLGQRGGSAVDHFSERRGRLEAMMSAAGTTGPAIFGNTLAVSLGFGVLMLSQVPANARLGGLLVLSLLNCLIATIVFLPALVALGGRFIVPAATRDQRITATGLESV